MVSPYNVGNWLSAFNLQKADALLVAVANCSVLA